MGDLLKNRNWTANIKSFEFDKMEQALIEASDRLGRGTKYMKKDSFAPSAFYNFGPGPCGRYWFYRFNGAEFVDSSTARQRANMDAGTAAGERIAGLFKEAGILIDDEVEVKLSDPPIRGFMDLLVEWQGEEMVGEVKTTKAESFNKRASVMAAPDYQLIQLLIYMHVFKKDKGFFVVENKNDHTILLLPVVMDEKNRRYVEYLFDWMRKVHTNATVDKKLPTRPYPKTSWNCKGCPVKDTCWEGFKKETKTRALQDPNPGVVDLPTLRMPK